MLIVLLQALRPLLFLLYMIFARTTPPPEAPHRSEVAPREMPEVYPPTPRWFDLSSKC